MTPPKPQARKKIPGEPALDAATTGVRKIPIPITRLTTIILRSNKFNCLLLIPFDSMDGERGPSAGGLDKPFEGNEFCSKFAYE
jgi:hypothetical protein